MKKALLLLLVATTFVLGACGTQKTNTAAPKNSETKVSSEKETSQSEASTESNTILESTTENSVTDSGENVTIKFPATLMNNDTASKGLSSVLSAVDALGYKYTSTDNEDGSKTITMSKEENEKVMKFLADSTVSQLKAMYVSDSYPQLKDLKMNDTYDSIDIATSAASESDLSEQEKGTAIMIQSTGLILELFHGTSGDDLNFTVNYVNDSSNQTIYSTQSKDNPSFDILK